MRKATVRDVANLASVSVATVSRVLNAKHGEVPISAESTERVLKAAKELKYTPNAIARSLVSRHTNIIGLVVPDIVHSYFPVITRGVQGMAYKEGYQVIVCDSEEDSRREEKQLQTLIERQCDGIIIAPASKESKSSVRMLVENEIPFVLIDRRFGTDYDFVGTDGHQGAFIATQHLLKHGHRLIAHVRGPVDVSSAEEYLRGYKDALTDAGIEINEDLIRGNGYYENHGHEAMLELLKLNPRPTAVLASNDPLAVGAFQAIDEAGLRVPQDIALVGSANLPYTSMLKVPLTTIDEHAELIGREAVKLLYERLKGSKEPAKQVLIKPELVIRESCGTE